MAKGTLAERIERLELTTEELRTLPGEVRLLGRRMEAIDGRVQVLESQVSQLRDAMHTEFSAVRQDMATLQDSLRREMREGFIAITTELGGQIETNWQRTLMLHESLVAQIRTIGERWDSEAPPAKRRRRKR